MMFFLIGRTMCLSGLWLRFFLNSLHFYFYVKGSVLTYYDLNEFLQLKVKVLSGRKVQANKFCCCMSIQENLSQLFPLFLSWLLKEVFGSIIECLAFSQVSNIWPVMFYQYLHIILCSYIIHCIYLIILYHICSVPRGLCFPEFVFVFSFFSDKLLILCEIKHAQIIFMSVFLHWCSRRKVFSRNTVLQIYERQ